MQTTKPITILSPENLVPKHQQALLLVTFGSTYPGPHQTFARIRRYFAERYPDRDIYMAFTSKMCMKRWAEKSGEQYYPADKWLEAIGKANYQSVSIQSLHIIPGLEYSFITEIYVPKFSQAYPHIPICVGAPLLFAPEDIARVGDVIYQEFASRLQGGEGLVLMGHGNHTDKFPHANGKYDELMEYLRLKDKKIAVGTVDYEHLLFDDVVRQLGETLPPPATLNYLPLMSVAGDHALNDMVGDYQEEEEEDEQSWRVRLGAMGYQSSPENLHMHGLGDYDSICAIWAEHLDEAESLR